MAGFRPIKLSDAVPHARDGSRAARHGLTHLTLPPTLTQAEQAREAQESARAREAGPSARGRMARIGRANQQAGRQK